jgi:hypothetical protein
MKLFDSIGVEIDLVVLALMVVVLISIILTIIALNKMGKLKKKYNKFMEGSDGSNLESTILTRFKEIDTLKDESKKTKSDIKKISDTLLTAYQKSSIVKYDAFKEMGGKLSFSLCLLDENNYGMIITSMHSSREGCYTYVKEIIKGESFVLLSEEEKQALDEAKNKKSYLA